MIIEITPDEGERYKAGHIMDRIRKAFSDYYEAGSGYRPEEGVIDFHFVRKETE